jgi:hypothetical protein
MYLRVSIDSREVLDELDTDELAKELVRRKDWKRVLQNAANESFEVMTQEELMVSARDLVDAARYGRGFEAELKRFADDVFGIVL